MTPKKNYIDEKGNYHNVENLTLAQIYKRGEVEGLTKAQRNNDKGCLRQARELIICVWNHQPPRSSMGKRLETIIDKITRLL